MPCTRPQLTNKIVFVVSFVGNRGTFIRGYKAMVMDMEFLYHVGYILTSVLGLFAHELFYSILVRLQGPGGWGWGWDSTGRVLAALPSPLSILLLLDCEEWISNLLLGLTPAWSSRPRWPLLALTDPLAVYGSGLSLDSGTRPS